MAQSSHKNLPIFLIIIVVLGVALLFAALYFSGNQNDSEIDSLAKEKLTVQVDSGLSVDATYLPEDQMIEVWLNPHDEQIEFNTMALSLILSGGDISPKTYRPEIGEEFVGGSWSVPFAEIIQEETSDLKFNIALINSSTDIYNFNQPHLLASFSASSEDPSQITTLVDSAVSNYYDGSVSEYSFSNSNMEQSINIQ